MIYLKAPGNPRVAELTKSCKGRSTNLDGLRAIKVEVEGKLIRKCAWCAEGELSHGNQKYCSSACSSSAMAWAYPQKEDALRLLLVAQDWKCKLCNHDYRPAMEEVLEYDRKRYGGPLDINTAPWYYLKRLKDKVAKELRLEVDHIIPIYKGGESIGLDNHQAICYSCHKTKTKVDLSGKRKKDETGQEGSS